MKSVAAGMFIALAAIIYLAVAPSNIFLGTFLFSMGLLTILIYKFNLFTGKAGKLSTGDISGIELGKIWIGNFVGVIFISLLAINWMPFTIAQQATQIAIARMSANPVELLIGGIFCGMLMYIATAADTPLWAVFLYIMGFICAGFYHCIADMAYFCLAQRIEIGLMIKSLCSVTLGNLLGCNIIPILTKYINV